MSQKVSKRTIVLKETKEREEILKALAESGGKILHDSGERVLVIEVPEDNKVKLEISLPRTSGLFKLADNKNIIKKITRPSEHEQLFIDALKLRTSETFINEKKLRKPGSTIEEKEMLMESDFLDDIDIDKFN